MSQPWHAAFRSSAEQITVVIGASSEGREKDQRGEEMIPRARNLGPCQIQRFGTYIAWSDH